MSTVQEVSLPEAGSTAAFQAEDAVKARGYWEQVWLRLKRDRLALAVERFG